MQFVSVEQLALFIGRCFIAAEVPEDDAKIVAELMSEADVNGSDGHGVFRLPQYIERIKNKGINLQPNISIAEDKGAMAVVDGDNALGIWLCTMRRNLPSSGLLNMVFLGLVCGIATMLVLLRFMQRCL